MPSAPKKKKGGAKPVAKKTAAKKPAHKPVARPAAKIPVKLSAKTPLPSPGRAVAVPPAKIAPGAASRTIPLPGAPIPGKPGMPGVAGDGARPGDGSGVLDDGLTGTLAAGRAAGLWAGFFAAVFFATGFAPPFFFFGALGIGSFALSLGVSVHANSRAV